MKISACAAGHGHSKWYILAMRRSLWFGVITRASLPMCLCRILQTRIKLLKTPSDWTRLWWHHREIDFAIRSLFHNYIISWTIIWWTFHLVCTNSLFVFKEINGKHFYVKRKGPFKCYVTPWGVEGCQFSQKKRVTRGWVGVKFPGKNVT